MDKSGAMGEVQVRSFIGKSQFSTQQWLHEIRNDAFSGTQLRTKEYNFTLSQHEFSHGGGTVTMSREGNRDTLKVVCMQKPRDAQSVTS